MNGLNLLLSNVAKCGEHMLKVTYLATTMKLSDEAKRAMGVISESMDLLYYKYDFDSCTFEELRKSQTEQEI